MMSSVTFLEPCQLLLVLSLPLTGITLSYLEIPQ